jgi:hypothetical protein
MGSQATFVGTKIFCSCSSTVNHERIQLIPDLHDLEFPSGFRSAASLVNSKRTLFSFLYEDGSKQQISKTLTIFPLQVLVNFNEAFVGPSSWLEQLYLKLEINKYGAGTEQ